MKLSEQFDGLLGCVAFFASGVIITLALVSANAKEVIVAEDNQTRIPDLPGVGLVLNACINFGVPFEIGLSVAWVESNCNHDLPDSKNFDGSVDRGYMQLNSLYHDERVARDIKKNIYAGIKYLKEMYEEVKGKYGEDVAWYIAIVRYNVGYKHDQAAIYLGKVLAARDYFFDIRLTNNLINGLF